MKIDDDQKVFKTSEEVCSIWLVWISISHSFACSKCEWTTSQWILLFRALRKAGMMLWHNSLREARHVFAGVCVHMSLLQHACLIFESPSGDLRATALLHASVECSVEDERQLQGRHPGTWRSILLLHCPSMTSDEWLNGRTPYSIQLLMSRTVQLIFSSLNTYFELNFFSFYF